MKITPELIKDFENDREMYGTKTAIFNLLWLKASEDLHDLGAKRVRTSKHRDHDITRHVS